MLCRISIPSIVFIFSIILSPQSIYFAFFFEVFSPLFHDSFPDCLPRAQRTVRFDSFLSNNCTREAANAINTKSCILPSLILNNSFLQPFVSLGSNSRVKICHLAVSQSWQTLIFPVIEAICGCFTRNSRAALLVHGRSHSLGNTKPVKTRLHLLVFLVQPHCHSLVSRFQHFYLPKSIS